MAKKSHISSSASRKDDSPKKKTGPESDPPKWGKAEKRSVVKAKTNLDSPKLARVSVSFGPKWTKLSGQYGPGTRRTPNAALAAIVGTKPLRQTEIFTILVNYAKKHGLQGGKNNSVIWADTKLRKIFGNRSYIFLSSLNAVIQQNTK